MLAFHPKLDGTERVLAVSCKSWQSGFNPTAEIAALDEGKILRGRKAWQSFREFLYPKVV